MDNIFKYVVEEQWMIRNVKPWEQDLNYFKLHNMDNIFKYVVEEQWMIRNVKPWEQDLNYFKDSKKLICIKTTETRVNAQAQAYEYMTNYSESCEPAGRLEKVIGWYHSHPGYGCWLSGIDVNTQFINQQYQEPFVAIVIDPIRTISAGKVDIGATLVCIYYSLDVTYFKSSLDTKLFDVFWNTYWVAWYHSHPVCLPTAEMKDTEDLKQQQNQIICEQRSSNLKKQWKDMKQLKKELKPMEQLEHMKQLKEELKDMKQLNCGTCVKALKRHRICYALLVARRGGHERPDVRRYSSGGIQGCGVDGRNQVPDMSPLGVAPMGSTSQADSLV
ncbi:hypothetical protein GPALN_014382 [Globodera pallida]|nr:hypothetical protein GPALN_014382 [Globodera pallida]